MSKPDPGHELLKGQLITGICMFCTLKVITSVYQSFYQLSTDEELSAQKSSEIVSKGNRNRDSVTPFAKDVVDNVLTGALSVLDVSRKEGKLKSGKKGCLKKLQGLKAYPTRKTLEGRFGGE